MHGDAVLSVTRKLAEFVANSEDAALPEWTIHEAKRTLLNLFAISLSASRSDDAGILVDWARREGCAARASRLTANRYFSNLRPRKSRAVNTHSA